MEKSEVRIVCDLISRSRPKFKGQRSEMIFKEKVSNWNFKIQKTLPKQYENI